MTAEDEKPHLLLGRAGLLFAYVCFAIAVATIAAAIYLLPLDWKVKLFLSAATFLLTSLFVFLAILTYLVTRQSPAPKPSQSRQKKPDSSANEGLG